MPQRLQLSRAKGFRLPEGAVSVARPGRWGNIFWPGKRVIVPGAYGAEASPYNGSRPTGVYGKRPGPRQYTIRKVRNVAEAVAFFIDYIRHDPSGWPPEEIQACLGGRDLACWCPLPRDGEPDICHAAAALIPYANGWRMVTPDVPEPGDGFRMTAQRCCNGCGCSLGDVTLYELKCATAGAPLPDVRGECPHCVTNPN